MSSPKQDSTYSEPGYAKSDRKKTDYPWYLSSIDKHLLPEVQDLLKKYSNVPRDQQSQHVHEIRDQAWAIRSYPCTGLGIWLIPFISRSPAYPQILKRLQAGDTFMDVGCFVGTDLRQLAFDGAPSQNLHGVDIVSHWEVGYALYRDRDRFAARYIEADFLSDDEPALQALQGRVDVISVSAVLHQWAWKDQVEAGKKLVSFSRPGSLVVGYQMGNVEAQEAMNEAIQVPQWRHDPASFERMWDQVGSETGSMWETTAWLRSWEDMGCDIRNQTWLEPGDRIIDFVVTRLR